MVDAVIARCGDRMGALTINTKPAGPAKTQE
jgi:hypothetical protein